MSSKKNQSVLNVIIIFLILSLMVIFLFLNNLRIFQRRTEHLSILEQLEEKEQELKDQKKYLEKDLEAVDSQDYLERIAREQLRWVKPGEKVVVIQIEKILEEEPEEESSFWEFDWLLR